MIHCYKNWLLKHEEKKMSGRKAGEVSALLRQGADVRKVADSNFNSAYNELMDLFSKYQSKVDDITRHIASSVCDFSSEAKTEFFDECTQLENEWLALKKNIPAFDVDIAGLQKNKKRFAHEFNRLDSEADRIHAEIRNHPHYNDPQYAEAKKLLKQYRELSRQQQREQANMRVALSEMNQCVARLHTDSAGAENIFKKVTALNEKAKNIVELRNRADDAKQFVSSIVNTIDKVIGEKFLKNEMADVLARYNQWLNLDNKNLLAQFNTIQKTVSVFKNKLDGVYEKFLAEKAAAENHINETALLLTKDKFYDSFDYAKHAESAKVIPLLDFLNDYGNGKFVDEIKASLKKAKADLSDENFSEVHIGLQNICETISEATAYATELQEKGLTSIRQMVDLQNVFKSLDFKVKSEIIDDKIKITASTISGDESIECSFGDDGILNIMHHESVTGTCHTSWDKIKQAGEQQGFLLEDVKKDGRSIFEKRAHANSERLTSPLK